MLRESLVLCATSSKVSKDRSLEPASGIRPRAVAAFTLRGLDLGWSRPASLRSRGLVMRKADFFSGVTPSALRAQLNS